MAGDMARDMAGDMAGATIHARALNEAGHSMKVAIHNPFFGQPFAEAELARRLTIALARLGVEAVEFGDPAVLEAHEPDFVLVLHHIVGKRSRFPTYVCLWGPPAYYEGDAAIAREVASCDGYLLGAPAIGDWLADVLHGRGKDAFRLPFLPATQATDWREPDLSAPRLCYFGSNWDRDRHRSLFETLDAADLFDAYGPAGGWSFLTRCHRGTVPFDGQAVLEAIHRSGAGLCLHTDRHVLAATPSMRVFEIAAAGAVAVCEEHPFIARVLGDDVLTFPRRRPVAETAARLAEVMAWIAAHPRDAVARARRAHELVTRHFALERQLEPLLAEHRRRHAARRLPADLLPAAAPLPAIDVIVRTDAGHPGRLRRALDSLVAQDLPGLTALVVCFGRAGTVRAILDEYDGRLASVLIPSRKTGLRSTQLWDGLRRVGAPLFAILDDDDLMFPGHLAGLCRRLAEDPGLGMVYAGALRIHEGAGDEETGHEGAGGTPLAIDLGHFSDVDPDRLLAGDSFVHPISLAARRGLLTPDILEDPRLAVAEDFFLVLLLAGRGRVRFTHEVGCAFFWRDGENTNFLPPTVWDQAMARIARLLGGRPALGTAPFRGQWFSAHAPAEPPGEVVRRQGGDIVNAVLVDALRRRPRPLPRGAALPTPPPAPPANRASPLLLDAALYLHRHPEVAAAGMDAATHYRLYGEAQGLSPHPLFDPAFYGGTLAHYLGEGAAAGRSPHPLFDPAFYGDTLAHYLGEGAAAGRSPHPLFDPAFYHAQVSALMPGLSQDDSPHDFRELGGRDPLSHFLLWGAPRGLDPHPLFGTRFYLERYPEVAAAGFNPLVHYVLYGRAQGLTPHPLASLSLSGPALAGLSPHPLFDTAHYAAACPEAAGAELAHYRLYGHARDLSPHPLFDPAFYRAQTPELADSPLDPLSHFLAWGADADRDPHPLFDLSYYRACHPDVVQVGFNPLVHYLLHGGERHLLPHPLFDTAFYRRHMPAEAAGVPPLLHYVRTGAAAGLWPHPLFDPAFYRAGHPPARPEIGPETGPNPLVHFVTRGAAAGRTPHPLLDMAFYRERYPEAAALGLDPLTHFVVTGVFRGFEPAPMPAVAWEWHRPDAVPG
jgi:hypothetical protein